MKRYIQLVVLAFAVILFGSLVGCNKDGTTATVVPDPAIAELKTALEGQKKLIEEQKNIMTDQKDLIDAQKIAADALQRTTADQATTIATLTTEQERLQKAFDEKVAELSAPRPTVSGADVDAALTTKNVETLHWMNPRNEAGKGEDEVVVLRAPAKVMEAMVSAKNPPKREFYVVPMAPAYPPIGFPPPAPMPAPDPTMVPPVPAVPPMLPMVPVSPDPMAAAPGIGFGR